MGERGSGVKLEIAIFTSHLAPHTSSRVDGASARSSRGLIVKDTAKKLKKGYVVVVKTV
jgi:hypothetical protein